VKRSVINRRTFVTLAGAGTAAAFGIPAYLPRIGRGSRSAEHRRRRALYRGLRGGGPKRNTRLRDGVDAWNKRAA